MYCAAAVKPALEEVAKVYYKETGVQIDLQYGGSGTLLSNLRIAKQGDLYLSADASYMQQAIKYNLIKESKPLVVITPVLAVAENNPKQISNITEVCKEGIKFGIANPDAASIGSVTRNMLLQSGDWNVLKNCIYVQMPTVSDVANALKLKTIDVGVIWDVTANQYKEIDTVKINFFKEYKEYATIGVLKSSSQVKEASEFMNFLIYNSKSKRVFKKFGYNISN
ncbi:MULTISPECIES: molybdate ABC transporter substrate-binding protein [unclassified Cellulophaga]|uniref:molybdate ABC transporter substrate-binding protein n=1 Tax=unclassified Cellulophaga TaxID=2634405 RepID=UPI0026E31B33|nr:MULTISPECIES: molybdate ABC transporter substrate-binding protein [unclassified Cellulophaga]MDO6491770.1 molybdate ABC transporter substrate-binding protein [Cellulophaga sp. 2_MG-2023]MDO6495575.1 molybdate ABC transporter substrate-binding protein [Cellulophaga sp. 3_MG-2023]